MIKESGEKKFYKRLFAEGGTDTKEDYHYAGGNWEKVKDGEIPTPRTYYSEYHKFFYDHKASKLFPWIDKERECKEHCVCGAKIIEQCYLVNVVTEKTIVVGDCCIMRYFPDEREKRCSVCNEPVKYLKAKFNFTCKSCRLKEKQVEERKEAEKSQLQVECERWERHYRKTSRMDNWTFGKKNTLYKDVVEKNHNLASWIMKNKDTMKPYLVDYLQTRLHFDENCEVVMIYPSPDI